MDISGTINSSVCGTNDQEAVREWFTGHSEGHHSPNLPLEAVGGRAGVVAGVTAGHFGEVKMTVLLLQVGRQLSSVCRGGRRDSTFLV